MRKYADALAWIKSQVTSPTQSWANLCQSISRQAVGADAWAPSAREAFNAIPAEHRHTSWPPPAGSIAYWGNASSGFGHATFVGPGVFFSNDIKRPGKIDTVPVTTRAQDAAFVKQWGLPYRGWIDWTPSGPIDIPPPPKPSIPQRVFTPHQAHLIALVRAARTRKLTAHELHVLHAARVAGKVTGTPPGKGPDWLIGFLRARKVKQERARFAVAMRESGGDATCRYPAGAPLDGDWSRTTAPWYDIGLYQVNLRHVGDIKRLGYGADMRAMLDPEKNLDFAVKHLSWSDWGLVVSADGSSYRFDWSGWPSDWVAKYAADAEAGFRQWWDAYPKYASKL